MGNHENLYVAYMLTFIFDIEQEDNLLELAQILDIALPIVELVNPEEIFFDEENLQETNRRLRRYHDMDLSASLKTKFDIEEAINKRLKEKRMNNIASEILDRYTREINIIFESFKAVGELKQEEKSIIVNIFPNEKYVSASCNGYIDDIDIGHGLSEMFEWNYDDIAKLPDFIEFMSKYYFKTDGKVYWNRTLIV